jgi:acetylornithine deacetylase/succinyl-diaminopimelate desuccinylase-like protein
MIHAGVEQSSVPDVCEVTFDRRLIPGETHETALRELDELVRDVAEREAEFQWSIRPLLWFEPCEIDADHTLVRTIADAAAEVIGRPAVVNASAFASDVTELVHVGGIEAVQFGPGDIALAHAPDERTPVAEVRAAGIILTLAALRLLRGD